MKERIRELTQTLILRHGLSNADLMRICGISRAQSYKLVNGAVVDLVYLVSIVRYCDEVLVISKQAIELKQEVKREKTARTAEPLNDKKELDVSGKFNRVAPGVYVNQAGTYLVKKWKGSKMESYYFPNKEEAVKHL